MLARPASVADSNGMRVYSCGSCREWQMLPSIEAEMDLPRLSPRQLDRLVTPMVVGLLILIRLPSSPCPPALPLPSIQLNPSPVSHPLAHPVQCCNQPHVASIAPGVCVGPVINTTSYLFGNASVLASRLTKSQPACTSTQGIPGWNKEQLVNEMFEAMATVDGDDDSVISDDDMPGLIAIDKDEPSLELIQSVRKVPVNYAPLTPPIISSTILSTSSHSMNPTTPTALPPTSNCITSPAAKSTTPP